MCVHACALFEQACFCSWYIPGQSFGMIVCDSKMSGGLGLLSPVSTSTYTHDIRKTNPERVIELVSTT